MLIYSPRPVRLSVCKTKLEHNSAKKHTPSRQTNTSPKHGQSKQIINIWTELYNNTGLIEDGDNIKTTVGIDRERKKKSWCIIKYKNQFQKSHCFTWTVIQSQFIYRAAESIKIWPEILNKTVAGCYIYLLDWLSCLSALF